MTYQGHRNWHHWNVSLWLFNEEYLYNNLRAYVEGTSTLDSAAAHMLYHIERAANGGPATTPDGAPYTFTSIRAAIAGWEA